MMRRDDHLVVSVDDFAAKGKSIAKVDGKVLFVSGAVPGDVVKARIVKTKKAYAEAEVVEVLEESPRRVRPECSHFGPCGGCRWQQVGYREQLDFKRRQVLDALIHVGGFGGISVSPTAGSEDIYYYRNKMEFSFGEEWLPEAQFVSRKEHPTIPSGVPALGLHPAGLFSKVLNIDACHLQSPLSNRTLDAVRRFAREDHLSCYSTVTHTGFLRNLVVREGKRTGDVMVNIVTSDDRPDIMRKLTDQLLDACPEITTVVNNITDRKSQVATGDYERVYHGTGSITERIGKKLYRISANSFFQTNTAQAERLYDIAVSIAELRHDDVVYDLYSGTGTIGLHLSDHVSRVVGIETVESAVLDARANAELNGVTNCYFETGDLKEKLTNERGWIDRHGSPSVIILDPPRSGTHAKVIREILRLQPGRIVYISCNPATQARDLKLMCADGSYLPVGVQPVDMFPHTDHIECVVGLKRNEM